MRKSARHCVVRSLTIGACKEANPPCTYVRVVAVSLRSVCYVRASGRHNLKLKRHIRTHEGIREPLNGSL
jgi:hypothetical protein